ncbi:unnamed protein product [Ceutorhynchus assimilis]|uniref:MICOS complex subunit MIC19 n=1 Tax=Ceutorhynchus assimilis TaxID=467358 RepID=A0A9N9QNX9_9CUCU|nr:unnamed protein product [Ceutorhynchus assimilis]
MGSGTSKTRTLTVENEDPTSVIKVSDDVAERLRGAVRASNQKIASSDIPPQVVQVPVYLHEPSLTSLQLRQQNIAELQKNDEYWHNRVEKIQDNHKKVKQAMDDEYKKALEEFKTGKATQSLREIPCLDSKKAVIDCYKSNAKEPMKCSKIVQAFQECVDHKRASLLAARTG